MNTKLLVGRYRCIRVIWYSKSNLGSRFPFFKLRRFLTFCRAMQQWMFFKCLDSVFQRIISKNNSVMLKLRTKFVFCQSNGLRNPTLPSIRYFHKVPPPLAPLEKKSLNNSGMSRSNVGCSNTLRSYWLKSRFVITPAY